MKRAFALSTALLTSPAWAQAPGGEAPPTPVTVIEAQVQDHVLTTRLPGRVKVALVAEVRPQVSGLLRNRLFEEGSTVEAGQPLYEIEDDSYRAAVAAASAAVAQAKASFELAKTEERRALELFENNAGSAQKRDSAIANRQAAEAAFMAAEAQLLAAEINLDRTVIRAPIAGVIGLSDVSVGALLSAQQPAALATIRDLNNVHVDVTQSAVDILRWNATLDQLDVRTSGEATLILADGSTYPVKGKLAAAEPKVEPTTGMVTLRMAYPNPDHILLPGMYVEVDLPQALANDAVAVPQNAVMRDRSGGTFVWVVDAGAVAVRPVEVVTSEGNLWILSSGLKEGDQVITSGFQKIGPGAPVAVVPAAAATGPTATDATATDTTDAAQTEKAAE
ncbi:efflux RND transporter periplasmic adaptor subunit [Xinfangfangia sp. CPCC 101601]|uniref:Efflux RND transporter periplasmic adaptor subunit n=1 Tax=Pseudogemmobacter lacusdianii TaxID=3069608 RepID=A0ABU0VWK9_9RHOB|nr:efflux RND transporter periplasmic adaptor subunit [Xinfangfangia sp. CPCC 101601]MDQ2066008.1 efflux RND transporter periplasmic adaptor subunit [Xinfangfangia sp. CPCC 101601]